MRIFTRVMVLLWGLMAGWSGNALWAQAEIAAPGPGSLTNPVGAEQIDAPLHLNPLGTEAMWDTQFAHDVSAAAGFGGQAAAIFVNGEFWTARWQSDTLYRYQPDGSYIDFFVIPQGGGNLGGTRAMTTDGTDVFLANNTNTIYRIDTATRAITGTIPTPIAQVRFLTYDSLANAGNGGLWVGNFNTDITLVNLSGAIQATILASTHTLGGMYGAAVDNSSNGGPYLWVFHQSGRPSGATISQLELPAGTPTGVIRDVSADLNGTANALAGGLFIADGIVPGQATLGGLLQDGPNQLFGYELDFQPIQNDVALSSFSSLNGLTQIPERLVQPLIFEARYTNQGLAVADTLEVKVEILKDGNSIFSDTRSFANVATGANGSVVLGPYTPDGQGSYEIIGSVNVPGVTDEQTLNDTISYTLQVTESTVARDDGIHNGGAGYLVSSASDGLAIVLHTFATSLPLAGVEIEVETPQHGDITYAVVVPTNNGVPIGGPAFTGTPVVLDSAVNTYYLPFPATLPLPPGTYGIGIYEDSAGIFLRQSQNIFTPGVNYFSTNQTSWTASGIATARFIRPRIADCAGFTLALTATSDGGSSNGTATVGGTFGPVTIVWDDPASQTTAEAIGLSAGTYTVTVTDSLGCTYTDSVEVPLNVGITEAAAGIDRLQLSPNPSQGRFALSLDLQRAQAVQLRVLDLQGRELRTFSLPSAASHQQELDLGELPAGLYLLRVATETGFATRRLIKE